MFKSLQSFPYLSNLNLTYDLKHVKTICSSYWYSRLHGKHEPLSLIRVPIMVQSLFSKGLGSRCNTNTHTHWQKDAHVHWGNHNVSKTYMCLYPLCNHCADVKFAHIIKIHSIVGLNDLSYCCSQGHFHFTVYHFIICSFDKIDLQNQ